LGEDFFKKSSSLKKGVAPHPFMGGWGGGWKRQINEKLTFIKKWLTEVVDKSFINEIEKYYKKYIINRLRVRFNLISAFTIGK
jgi:hypothetical protein